MWTRPAVALTILLLPATAAADGLYARFGVGPGLAAGVEEVAGTSDRGGAAAISTELALGTRVRPGLVVGGGTYPMVVPGPGYHLSATGPFVALDRHRGLHAQVALLLTAGYHEARAGRDSAIGLGYGAMVGAGYDLWHGARWSIGPVLRVTYYHWRGGDYVLDQVTPSLLLAFTRHTTSRGAP